MQHVGLIPGTESFFRSKTCQTSGAACGATPLISRQVDKSQDPNGACQHPPEEVNGNTVEGDPETKEVADTKHQSLGCIERCAEVDLLIIWFVSLFYEGRRKRVWKISMKSTRVVVVVVVVAVAAANLLQYV